MNINELERLTGITRQNIRFYEKKGLLHPMRNSENNYREYSQEDLSHSKRLSFYEDWMFRWKIFIRFCQRKCRFIQY